MRERPILFSAPMVRAILEGRKTQTRRVIKPQPTADLTGCKWIPSTGFKTTKADPPWMHAVKPWLEGIAVEIVAVARCPARVGDRLWVRETWQFADWTDDGAPLIRYCADSGTRWALGAGDLSDVWAALSEPDNYAIDNKAADRRWRPSIHMPRWASRIDLEVTGVRVERLQDINENDAHAEGIEWNKCPTKPDPEYLKRFEMAQRMGMATHYSALIDYVGGFRNLWESINGADSWAANPWVWVVEFRRIKPAKGEGE